MSKPITHAEKIVWMHKWCADQGLQLNLEGECGFGRECVGVTAHGTYPDYHWFDENFEPADDNGEVWTPPNAYHKHDCVAVLGRGEAAEAELFDWLQWFDANGFIYGSMKNEKQLHPIEAMLGRHTLHRMIRFNKAQASAVAP